MFRVGKVIEHRIDASVVKCVIETMKIDRSVPTNPTVKYRIRPAKGGKAFWTPPHILA